MSQKHCTKVAHNGQRLGDVVEFKKPSPELLLNKDIKVKVNKQKPNRYSSAGTAADNELLPIVSTSGP